MYCHKWFVGVLLIRYPFIIRTSTSKSPKRFSTGGNVEANLVSNFRHSSSGCSWVRMLLVLGRFLLTATVAAAASDAILDRSVESVLVER
jgi:hypothetical protein